MRESDWGKKCKSVPICDSSSLSENICVRMRMNEQIRGKGRERGTRDREGEREGDKEKQREGNSERERRQVLLPRGRE